MTNYHLDKIQSNIEAYLRTSPDADAVNSLIERLKEYESERQRASVQADLAWKEQLTQNFRDKKLREKFRRMFNQLQSQGIKVKHSVDFSDDEQTSWHLEETETGKSGRLMWYRRGKEWAMYSFRFEDEKGNTLKEFDHVAYH